MDTKEKNNNGITLVALVVSIIVMLILAGVSLNAAIGDNGIVLKAIKAREDSEAIKVQEDILAAFSRLSYYESAQGDYGKNLAGIYNIENLNKLLDGRVNYVRVNNATGEKVVYYTYNGVSYTTIINKQGKATTKVGLLIMKNGENAFQMDTNENITLATYDDDYTYWEVDSESSEILEIVYNGTTPLIKKNKEGKAKINAYKTLEDKEAGASPIKIEIQDITDKPTNVALTENILNGNANPMNQFDETNTNIIYTNPEEPTDPIEGTNEEEEEIISDIYVFYYNDIDTLAFSHNNVGIEGHNITASWNNKDYNFSFDYMDMPWKNYIYDYKNVVFLDKIYPTNIRNWFSTFTELETITNLNYLVTDNVTDMNSLFNNCTKVKELDLSSFNTSNVTDMSKMFYMCLSLESIDVTNFDTSKTTNMEQMFCGCKKIPEIDLSNFNTSNVSNMSSMFYNCQNIKNIDLNNFNTSNVTDMSSMFVHCSNLETISINNFDTTNVKTYFNMFHNCSNIKSLNLTSFNTLNADNMVQMFWNTPKLTYISVRSKWINCTNSNYMFQNCGTDHVTYVDDDGNEINHNIYANYYSNTKTLAFSSNNQKLEGQKPTETWSTVEGTITLSSKPWMDYDAEKVIFLNNIYPTEISKWFWGLEKLTTIQNINYLNTDFANNMFGTFYKCKSLTTLDLSHFNTSKVTSMKSMFYSCNKLTDLDLSNFDTSNVTEMYNMFFDCKKLVNLNVSNFNVSKVKGMSNMFYDCSSLKNLDLSSFSTSKNTTTGMMFFGCSNLESINLSNFDTTNTTTLYNMFSGCQKLKTLDLRSFKTTSDTTLNYMFFNCKALETVYVSDKWVESSNNTDMFYNCKTDHVTYVSDNEEI